MHADRAIGGVRSYLSSCSRLERIAAVVAIAAVAWVFIAPSVDLLDSTCSVDDGFSIAHLPATCVTPVHHPLLFSTLFLPSDHAPVVSRSGSDVREVTCSFLC